MTTETTETTTATNKKNSSDAYGAKSRGNVMMFDPNDLVIVDDKSSPLYDERIHLPVSERLVRNIMHHGVLEAIVFRKNPETGKSEVVAGRQRVRATRVANERLIAQGLEPILVPGTVRRGDDGALAGMMVSENEIREDDTPLGRAKKMERLLGFGKTEEDLCVLFGCGPQTVQNTLALLECCADVKKAVETGKITVTAAYGLSKKSVTDQRETLAKMIEAGEGATGKRERSKKMREASGKKTAPGKREIADLIADLKNGDETTSCSGEARQVALTALLWVIGEGPKPGLFKKAKEEAAE